MDYTFYTKMLHFPFEKKNLKIRLRLGGRDVALK